MKAEVSIAHDKFILRIKLNLLIATIMTVWYLIDNDNHKS